MKGNIILITHGDDFDGVTCAILFKSLFFEQEVIYVNYNTVNKKVVELIKENPDSYIYITDISVNEEVAGLLNKRGRVMLFDHHKTALWLNRYDWANVFVGRCGAMLFYEYLRSFVDKNISVYADLVYHANDYDLWLHKDSHSKVLNNLLYIYGRDKFVARFLDIPSVELFDEEKLMLEIEEEKRQRYVEESLKKVRFLRDEKDNPYGLVFAERYISEVGHYILDQTKPENCQYVAIVNMRSESISFRSRSEFDVSVIARERGGGGHKNAAGCVMSMEDIIKVVSL